MGSLVLTGNTSGSVTVAVPDVAGSNTATIGAATGTHYPFTAGTAVASTSGTSIDFTSIPSWVKRITVMLSGVSTSGTSNLQVQLGDSGGIENTGYVSGLSSINGVNNTAYTSSTTAALIDAAVVAANNYSGSVRIELVSGNSWVITGLIARNDGLVGVSGASKTLSDVLTQVRVTTANGTDTFDAGSINILYE